jgi:protein gp37
MDRTKIQWTDATWSPVTGCTRVTWPNRAASGCDHCYAFLLHDTRHAAKRQGKAVVGAQYDRPFSQVQLLPDRLYQPVRWRRPRRVFLTSMGDLFHPDVPDEYLALLWAVMAITPRHTYQVLTKRPDRAATLLRGPQFVSLMRAALYSMLGMNHGLANVRMVGAPDVVTAPMIEPAPLPRTQRDHLTRAVFSGYGRKWKAPGLPWPLPNVWLGTSIEHQQALTERWKHLANAPAVTRFYSMEPQLDAIDLSPVLRLSATITEDGPIWHTPKDTLPRPVNWVIVGGESGPRARVFQPAWVRQTIAQCAAAGVPVFVKQLGSVWGKANASRHTHGGEIEDWPADLRVREFPAMTAQYDQWLHYVETGTNRPPSQELKPLGWRVPARVL